MTQLAVPLEAEEGKLLVAYLRTRGYKFHHSPNETGSSPEARRRAIRMKQQGTSVGWPDYIIIVKNRLVAIELKRLRGSKTSDEQREWLQTLVVCGVQCAICKGAASAIEFIEEVAKQV